MGLSIETNLLQRMSRRYHYVLIDPDTYDPTEPFPRVEGIFQTGKEAMNARSIKQKIIELQPGDTYDFMGEARVHGNRPFPSVRARPDGLHPETR